jgi:hypothetical protein
MKSMLRVVHNVANGPNVDGYVDGTLAIRNFSYKGTTDYLEIKPGKHLITVKIAGTNNNIVNGEITVEPGKRYTLIVHGLINDPKTIAPLLIEDNITCPELGKAHVRFVHAAAGVPPVDVSGGRNRIFSQVSYGQVGNPEYLPVNAGTVEISVSPSGSNTPVLGPINLRLENRGVYTVIASGLVGDINSPIAALINEDSKGSCVITNL